MPFPLDIHPLQGLGAHQNHLPGPNLNNQDCKRCSKGSDVRILSRSSRNCTITGIDSHELQGLYVVQCAALVETNHGTVNLIMNEYAWYGKGHIIHSSGQIEWFENSVDDRSVYVGGKQKVCTIDGYSMPLVCRHGLM